MKSAVSQLVIWPMSLGKQPVIVSRNRQMPQTNYVGELSFYSMIQ